MDVGMIGLKDCPIIGATGMRGRKLRAGEFCHRLADRFCLSISRNLASAGNFVHFDAARQLKSDKIKVV